MCSKEWKEDLLGNSGKIHATFNHIPNLDKLLNVLKLPDVAAPLFCAGCGTTMGLRYSDAINLVSLMPAIEETVNSVEFFNDLYFLVNVCPFCDSNNGDTQLKKISSLITDNCNKD